MTTAGGVKVKRGGVTTQADSPIPIATPLKPSTRRLRIAVTCISNSFFRTMDGLVDFIDCIVNARDGYVLIGTNRSITRTVFNAPARGPQVRQGVEVERVFPG